MGHADDDGVILSTSNVVIIDSQEALCSDYRIHRPAEGQFELRVPHQHAGSGMLRATRKRKREQAQAEPELPGLEPEWGEAEAARALEVLAEVRARQRSSSTCCRGAATEQGQWRGTSAEQCSSKQQASGKDCGRDGGLQPAWREASDWSVLYSMRAVVRPKFVFDEDHGEAGGQVGNESGSQDVGTADLHEAGANRTGSRQGSCISAATDAFHAGFRPGCSALARRASAGGGRQGGGRCSNLFNTLITNDRERDVAAWAHDVPVVVPAASAFLMSDVREMRPLVAAASASGGFQLAVVDPPWENASARRSRRYETLPCRHLLGLPLPQLLCQEGAVVALWVTNRRRIWRFVRQELLPAWGLQAAATWLWLKVALSGEPVTPLGRAHRKPFEPILLLTKHGRTRDGTAATARAGSVATPGDGGRESARAAGSRGPSLPAGPAGGAGWQPPPPPLIPDRQVLVSVPGEHSRKPQLAPLLEPLAAAVLQQPAAARLRCLELFARQLTPGWTSWGNEVLYFQQRCFFQ